MRTFAQKPKGIQQTTSAKSTKPSRSFFGQSRNVHSILHLQRTIGNQAVLRLLQTETENINTSSASSTSIRFAHNFSRLSIYPSIRNSIQPKLKVNASGDRYEQEADRIADEVLRQKMPEEDDKKVHIQARASQQTAGGDRELNEELKNRLSRSKRSGIPISDQVRAFVEPRMQFDFSRVQVHMDNEAARMNQELGARAFTHGRDIYFGVGQYNPQSIEGKRLLAHELVHIVQQESKADSINTQTNRLTHISKMQIGIAREVLDAGVQEPRDASLPGGVPEEPQEEQHPEQQERQEETESERAEPQYGPQPGPAPVCTAQYQRATNFQSLIDLVRAAESRLNAAGITSTREQIHALRGIYYGTTWSQDYVVERSTTRNEGFQRFTRPSLDPTRSVPRDVRPLLDCGLFAALQSSQDITDGSRHVDFGHLIIGLDARYDPAFTSNIQYPVMLMNIDLGGTGPELVTWLGDLGGGAAALASRRVSTPGTNARSVFTGTDYGGSINLEGDIAGFVVATSGSARPTAPMAPAFAPGRGRLSDALQDYLSPSTPSPAWTGRSTTFLRMYGGTFDASSNALTNSPALITPFSRKIQRFACNYLASRVRDGHMTYAEASAAANHVIPASREVATAFVNALEDSHGTGMRIEARRFPSPSPASPGACRQQLAAAGFLGIFSEVQPKLTVSTLGDIYEREADLIADQVMRMRGPTLKRACTCGGGCPKCRKEQGRQKQLQAKPFQASVNNGSVVPSIVHDVLNSSGQPLDAGTRAFMEPRFGHNFSQVRVHNDTRAADSAEAIKALAYTIGREVVFGTGQYAPETSKGRKLLAHELTHVLQQNVAADSRIKCHVSPGLIQRVRFGDDGEVSPAHQSTVREAAEIAETRVDSQEFRERWDAFWQRPSVSAAIRPRPSLTQYRSGLRGRVVHNMDTSRRTDIQEILQEENDRPLERRTAAVTPLSSNDTYIRQFAIEQGIDTVVSILLHESIHGAGVSMGFAQVYEPALHEFEAEVGFPMMMGGANILAIQRIRRGFNAFNVAITFDLYQIEPGEPIPSSLEIQIVEQLTGNVVHSPQPDGSDLPARQPIASRTGQGRWVWQAVNQGCRRLSARIVKVHGDSVFQLLGSRQFSIPCEFRVSR